MNFVFFFHDKMVGLKRFFKFIDKYKKNVSVSVKFYLNIHALRNQFGMP